MQNIKNAVTGEYVPTDEEWSRPEEKVDFSDEIAIKWFEDEYGERRGSYSLPKYPKNDPNRPPSEGYEWRGHPDKGSWYNPKTREVLRSDIGHAAPIGAHWDYRAPDGKWYRLYPDGHLEPK